MKARHAFRGLFGITVAAAVLVAAACSSSGGGKKGPGFNNLNQLNAVWKLTGTYSFLCNGATENVAITNATVYIFNGVFNTTLQWPTSVCGSNGVLFNGVVGADGSISGTVATNGGGSTLSDTLSGSCSATSCSGQSANTSEFSFTMTNTGTNPFDGSTWSASLQCSGGGGPSLGGFITVAQGQYSGPTQGYVICTSGPSITITSGTPVPGVFTVTITSDGNFSASVTQGTGDTLNFATTMTGLTNIGVLAGTDGAHLQFTRPTPN